MKFIDLWECSACGAFYADKITACDCYMDGCTTLNHYHATLTSAGNYPVIPDGSAGTNCIWSTDSDGIWLGDCGVTWQFFDDGPNENGLKYCPSCGKKVSVIAAPTQESE